MNINKINELKRLDFEDLLWIIFIIATILDILGDNYQKMYIITDNKYYSQKAKDTFTIVVIIALLIYLYFFCRNYKSYQHASLEEKELYKIKVFGSIFFIIGALCLLYFQINEKDSSIGGPAI